MRRPSPGVAAAAVVVAVVVALAPATRAAHAGGPTLAQVQQALANARSDEDDASAATTAAAAQLTAVQTQLSTAQSALAADRVELGTAQATKQQADVALAAAQQALTFARAQQALAEAAAQAQRERIRGYVVSAYETGTTPDALVLIAAGSGANDYLQRAGLLDQAALGEQRQLAILAADQARVDAAEQVVAQRTAAVADRQRAAAAAMAKVASVVAAAAATTAKLADLNRQRAAALAQAEAALAASRNHVAELQQESVQIAALIRQREAAAAAAAKRTAATQPSGPVGSYGLIWPLDGPIVITSGFGYRLDPVTHVYQLHAGIDLRASIGTPIHAAKAGTVIFAGQETGYGNYTCIDHGGGFSTCYAHQSAIEVTVGETVAQGQVIGLVGDTGYTTGPHLHFETRVNGNPENPLQFI